MKQSYKIVLVKPYHVVTSELEEMAIISRFLLKLRGPIKIRQTPPSFEKFSTCQKKPEYVITKMYLNKKLKGNNKMTRQ